MSVFVCVPTAAEIHGQTTAAVYRICASHRGGAEFWSVQAQPTDFARNECVKRFLATRHSHLFFVDSDVVPPDHTLDLLLAQDRPIVCGMYPLMLGGASLCSSLAMREPGGTYTFLKELPPDPFEIDAGGMGCCLIAREVLEQMPFPWFQFTQDEERRLVGEDIYFFEKALELGHRPLAVPQIQCSHFRVVNLLDVMRAVWAAKGLEVQMAS